LASLISERLRSFALSDSSVPRTYSPESSRGRIIAHPIIRTTCVYSTTRQVKLCSSRSRNKAASSSRKLEVYLADLPRFGVPIVVTKGARGASRRYALVYAQAKVHEAREHAGPGSHVTLDACRYGGMTELGDAAEQGVMALSRHKSPRAARLYVIRKQHQRVKGAAQRRKFVHANETTTRVENGGGF